MLISGLLLCACVSRSKYEAASASARDVRAELAAERARCEREVTELERRVAATQRAVDGATAENAGLRGALERLGTDVDALLAERGVLASELSVSRARLEELRRARTAAEERARLYRDLFVRLKKMVDAGSLSIVLRDGRMVLALPNDVLFDSGRTEIKPLGRDALRQVAAVLRTLRGRKFHVGGHTDDVPISTHRFPSNWELSMARGLEVLRLLVAEGVPPTALAVEGYGQFDPVALNDTPEGRAQNRRTEIALQPQVDELVAVPDVELE